MYLLMSVCLSNKLSIYDLTIYYSIYIVELIYSICTKNTYKFQYFTTAFHFCNSEFHQEYDEIFSVSWPISGVLIV